MIKAIIWDFGGVFTSSPFEAFTRFEKEQGLPANFLRQVNATNPDQNAWAQFERSEVDLARFDELFLRESTSFGHAVRGLDVIALLAGDPRPRMLAALRLAQQHYKNGCITNNVMIEPDDAASDGRANPAMLSTGEGQDRKISFAAEVMAEFDHIIESKEAGLRKPDPRIYKMMCDALQLAPEHCVYLDDLGINCKPAAQLGMQAIKVTDEESALAQLSAITGLDFL